MVVGLEAEHRGSALMPRDLRSPCWLLNREVKAWARGLSFAPVFQKLQGGKVLPQVNGSRKVKVRCQAPKQGIL